jgi:hypothetical protein
MALAMVPAGSSRPIEKIVPGPLCFDAHFGAPLPPAPGAAAPPPPRPPLGTPLPLGVHLDTQVALKKCPASRTTPGIRTKPQRILLGGGRGTPLSCFSLLEIVTV